MGYQCLKYWSLSMLSWFSGNHVWSITVVSGNSYIIVSDFTPLMYRLWTSTWFVTKVPRLIHQNCRCYLGFLAGLDTLYTQSWPIMLSRICLAATAGTSLVRDSRVTKHSLSYRKARAYVYTKLVPSQRRWFKFIIDQNSSLLPTANMKCSGGWPTFETSYGYGKIVSFIPILHDIE